MKNVRVGVSLLVALLATACGVPGQEFHGTYSASGTQLVDLGEYGQKAGPVSGTLSISEGLDSDIIITDASSCIVPYNVEEGVAVIASGTTCNVEGPGFTMTLTYTSGTATVTGKVVQLSYAGKVSIVADGRTFPGTFTGNITLTRVGK